MESNAATMSSPSSKYDVIKEIGKGSFGKVYQIRRVADSKLLVWKEINYGKMSEREKQLLVSEVNILRELRHPNITRYYDRVIDKDKAKLYIVMEFCSGGDLAGLIRKRKKQLRESGSDIASYVPEEQAWRILSQLTLALLECHMRKEGNKILHRDLKPGNVFFDADQNVKLGDFGLSRIMGDESVFAYTHVGTPYYMSPEQIQEQRYNEKSDIWSAGCVIYEMLALRAPFEATNQIQLAYKIKLGKIERIPAHYSDEIFAVISSMIALDPTRRPGVKNLMKHPRISFVIRQLEVRRKEADVQRKQDMVVQLEHTYKDKCDQYEKKVASMEQKRTKLRQLEEQLQRREAQLQAKNPGGQSNSSKPGGGYPGQVPTPASHRQENNPHLQLKQEQQLPPSTKTTSQARMDSTDRAISRILEQQVPLAGGSAATSTIEESKKDNDMVNINFKVERQQTSFSSGQDDNQQLLQMGGGIPTQIHSSQHQQEPPSSTAMKRQSYASQQISTGMDTRPSEDTQSSMANFSSVVVQTPQQSMIPKEMPSGSMSITSPGGATPNSCYEESKAFSSAGGVGTGSKPPSSTTAAQNSSVVTGGGLLSGIEMQRQKLQELKRGLNQVSTGSSRAGSSFVQGQQQDEQSSVVGGKTNGRYSNLDSQNYGSSQQASSRHGRYGSNAGGDSHYSAATNQSIQGGVPNRLGSGTRQRSNSANKLQSAAEAAGVAVKRGGGGIGGNRPQQQQQQPQANSYISRMRSQSRERMQTTASTDVLGRNGSQTRITGTNMSNPVVQQQKKPLPNAVHTNSSHNFQTPKQALAGMIKRNTSTGRGSGSRNRYDAQPTSQTTYLSSNTNNTQRSQTALPQHPGSAQPPSYSRLQQQHKYAQQQQQQSSATSFGGSRRASANQTQQVIPKTGLGQNQRYVSPRGSQGIPSTTQAASKAAQNYAMQQRRSSGSRLSGAQQQQSSTERLHNFGANTNLAMGGRGGRMGQRVNSRGDSVGNRPGSASGRATGGYQQPSGMIRQNSNSRVAQHQTATSGRDGSNTGGGGAGQQRQSSQRDLRNALEEITQRIQSKYLQV